MAQNRGCKTVINCNGMKGKAYSMGKSVVQAHRCAGRELLAPACVLGGLLVLGAAFGGGEAACELLLGPVWLLAAASLLQSWVLLGGVSGGSRPEPAAGPAWLTSKSGSCTRQHCL